MAKKISKRDLQALYNIRERLDRLAAKYEDIMLQHEDNGTIDEQLSCACAGIDCILQEYDF